jgi:hypothetical protein
MEKPIVLGTLHSECPIDNVAYEISFTNAGPR